jgi:hypothetical protein
LKKINGRLLLGAKQVTQHMAEAVCIHIITVPIISEKEE